MTVDELLALEEIKQVKYRYIRAMDTHDFELMAECFSDDATVAFSEGLYSMAGREAIIEFFRGVMTSDLTSSHVVTHPEIVFRNPELARAIWRLQDVIHLSAPNPEVKSTEINGGEELRGASYYYDEYVRRNGRWQIHHSGYRRIFRQVLRAGEGGTTLTIDPALGVEPGWL